MIDVTICHAHVARPILRDSGSCCVGRQSLSESEEFVWVLYSIGRLEVALLLLVDLKAIA